MHDVASTRMTLVFCPREMGFARESDGSVFMNGPLTSHNATASASGQTTPYP